ncbi:MAG: metal-sensitive transcriptional regulator [Peptococcaceae bacterium]|nr:metal-sensitive transcriptional regulator [Peptococcaceae bacterium]
MYTSVNKDVLNRLKTVKGHVSGIEKMIEQDQNCSDILLQLGAIRSAINKVSIIIAEHYALACYDSAIDNGADPKEVIRKAIQAVIKSNG